MSDNTVEWPAKADSLYYDPEGYKVTTFAFWIGVPIFILCGIGAVSSMANSEVGGAVALVVVGAIPLVVAGLLLEGHKNAVAEGKLRERQKLAATAERTLKQNEKLSDRIKVLEASVGEVLKSAIRTGDIIINGDHAAVVVGSGTIEVINGTKHSDPQLSRALTALAGLIENERNRKAASLLDSLTTEVAKPAPNKPLLEALWNGIVAAVPTVKAMTDITATMTKMFAP